MCLSLRMCVNVCVCVYAQDEQWKWANISNKEIHVASHILKQTLITIL